MANLPHVGSRVRPWPARAHGIPPTHLEGSSATPPVDIPTRLRTKLLVCALLPALVPALLSPLLVSGAASAGSQIRWSWPLAAPHPITKTYIAPRTPYGPGHRGIDIGGTADTPVLAPTDGVVSFAGVVVDRPVMSLRHPDGMVSSYEPVTTELLEGTPVSRGETIGTLLTGHCASPCLHFGTRRYGEYLSPLGFLGRVGYSVLLPTRTIKLSE